MRTKLQGGTVVGFNGHTHVLIREGVVVWEEDRSTFVGKTYDGPVDRTLVETVIVDGQTVMDNRHIPAAPALEALLGRAQRFAEAYWSTYPQLSWDGRTAAETFPNAFPWVEGPL